MIGRSISLCLALLAAITLGGRASAEHHTILLTEAHLEGFIGVMPELRAIAKRFDDRSNQPTSNTVEAIVRATQANAELAALLKKNGFRDAAEWGAVANAVAAAYNWLDETDDPEAALQAQIKEIETAPSLSDAQKASLLKNLRAQLEAVDDYKPPTHNVALVRRYRDKIAAVLEE